MELFRPLVGLPAAGPWPEQFTATGQGTHREGFVVEFSPDSSSSWVGNFQRGLTKYDAVILHPNHRSAIVIAGGQGYVVDLKDRHLVNAFGGQLQEAITLGESNIVVISNGVWLEAQGKEGLLWRTRRISFDGIWDLREEGGRLHGKCWDAANDAEASFSVDIRSGELAGGVYPEPPDLID